ncbi:MAG: aminotransferase class III-fold pyridoxal phosphate-dependent enzyme [Gammaproteobacteria bacterium]|nr:aminotransferase class III-fold pyridoxal phosphate-dependent enzyme [Gammaproteobacteria bacterium]
MKNARSIEQLLDRNVPTFPMSDIQQMVKEHFALEGRFSEIESERDQSFIITTANKEKFVVKISNRNDDYGTIDFQTQALLHIEQRNPSVPVPRIIHTQTGELCIVVKGKGSDEHIVRVLSFLPGNEVGDDLEFNTSAMRRSVGSELAKLGLALRSYFHPHSAHVHPWDNMKFMVYREHIHHIPDKKARHQLEQIFDYVNEHCMDKYKNLRHQVIHQDAHNYNVLVENERPNEVSGFIDFGDMVYAPLIMDVAVSAHGMITLENDDVVGQMCDVIASFDSVVELEEQEIDLLYDAILIRIGISIVTTAWRSVMRPAEPAHIDNIEDYWGLLDNLVTLGREQITQWFREACRFPTYSPVVGEQSELDQENEQQLLAKRNRLLGDNLWHFFKNPLHIERGRGPWLYGADGKAYLDLYNNVPQVGHCHPHVAKAIGRQAKVLNTNTRYLYKIILDYAERLTNLLPDQLDACIFFNSGSEANDVAWQIAKFITGHSGAIVIEDAYHGISDAIIQLSPEEQETETPPHVATLTAPCSYRGPHAGKENMAELYAADADEAIQQLENSGHRTACFMVDSAFCSSGVIDPPNGYLKLVGEKVRAAGGLVIADEVQSGFGRVGQWWGFEAHGLKADIVTMGKPVGNGFPLGIVVTSKKLLDSFTEQTGLFSTFGGNPVSCAAGMAVMDVIENENLIDNANSTGDYLRDRLRELAETQPSIGDVRGRGMLAAVEFVKDRETKVPAADETKELVELMRDQGVLIGRSGPSGNSLKLRPGLVFQPEHVDFFISALDKCLSQLRVAT